MSMTATMSSSNLPVDPVRTARRPRSNREKGVTKSNSGEELMEMRRRAVLATPLTSRQRIANMHTSMNLDTVLGPPVEGDKPRTRGSRRRGSRNSVDGDLNDSASSFKSEEGIEVLKGGDSSNSRLGTGRIRRRRSVSPGGEVASLQSSDTVDKRSSGRRKGDRDRDRERDKNGRRRSRSRSQGRSSNRRSRSLNARQHIRQSGRSRKDKEQVGDLGIRNTDHGSSRRDKDKVSGGDSGIRNTDHGVIRRERSPVRSNSASNADLREVSPQRYPSAGDLSTGSSQKRPASGRPPTNPASNPATPQGGAKPRIGSGKGILEDELMDLLSPQKDPEGNNAERGDRSVGGLERKSNRDREASVREKRSNSRERILRADPREGTSRPPRSGRSGVSRAKSSDLEYLISPMPSLRPRAKSKERLGGRPEPERRGVQRSRSTDDAMDLNSFFNASMQVSRRTRPPSSGNRSVASMGGGIRSLKSRSSASKGSSKSTSRSRKPSSSSSRRSADDASPRSVDGRDDLEKPSSKSSVHSDDDYLKPSSNPEFSASMSDFDIDIDVINEADMVSLMSDGDIVSNLESVLINRMNRTENLLYDVFPKHVAEALREGRKVEPENHECVTIFFSDIVGFTSISSELDPLKISDMLDRLYNAFDALSRYHDVFKVETIGDAYMAVTNLTKDQPDHTKRIAEFAIDAIKIANQTLIDKEDPSRGHVNIRVGFHSGPVVSNVVGSRNPRYCLFGDTVNTASRMESNSEENRIHCSDDAALLLKLQTPALRLNPRGQIEVKGKGMMNTFWVNEDETGHQQKNEKGRSIFTMMKKKIQVQKNKIVNRRGSMASPAPS